MGEEGNKVEEKLKEIRKSGIDIIGDVRWGTHLCHFYHTKEDLIDILVPYFKAGLENNEFCVWVTSESLSEKETKKAMKKAVPNFDRYLKKGQIEIIPHNEWYLKDGIFNLKRVLNVWIDKLNQALAKGYDGIRVTGNTAWLEKKDWRKFADYEEEVNNTISKYQMIAICTYCLDKCGAFEIIDVIKNHQFALIRRRGKWEIIESSERKKAEEKIHYQDSLLENVNECIISADMDGTIIHWNKGSEKMFGWKAEEAIGKHISFIYPLKFKNLVFQKMKEILQKGNLTYETLGIRKNGTSFLRNVSVSVLKNAEDQPIGFIGISTDISKIKKLEKDKKTLSEKVTKLTRKIPLTDNEKLVFYGLVKYPLLNDQQLSEKLKIKRSTITAIKNKLLRQGFYSTYVIPNFESIGCELMCILNGKAPIKDIEERKKLDIIKKVTSSPEVVYDIGTDKDFLSIIISKNFVEAKRLIDHVSMAYEGSDIEMPSIIYFPFEMSRIINLFDYNTLIKSLFDLKIEEDSTKPIKSSKRELTDNEKIILYALTKYPDLADTEIAAKTKISRPTVSQIKKNLLKENFLKIINIPDTKKLNCELLVYSNAKIDLNRINKQNPEVPSLIFMINNERESSGIFIFENYTNYKIAYDKLTSLLKEKQFIIGEPTRHLFPIQQIKFQKIDFAPLVKKIFDLKVNL